jgi:hypothetical protein
MILVQRNETAVGRSKAAHLSQEDVRVGDDEVTVWKEPALGRSSRREEGDLRGIDAGFAAGDTAPDVVPQVSLPKDWD